MYFSTKSYLKNTRNHTAKHALISEISEIVWIIDKCKKKKNINHHISSID